MKQVCVGLLLTARHTHRQHPTKYDEHHLKLARNQVCGRPRLAGIGTTSTKVRGLPKQQLPPQTLEAMRQRCDDGGVVVYVHQTHRWEEVVLPVSGYASYEALRQGVNRELGRRLQSSL